MTEFLETWIAAVAAIVVSALGCTVLELVAAEEKQSWASRARAVVFWSVLLAASLAVLMPTQELIRWAGLAPLISFDLRWMLDSQNFLVLIVAYLLLPFAPYFLFDVFYYWFHRLQHAVPFLWRFHAVHHSIEELNAANCYHHVFEPLFRVPLVILPTMLLIDLKVPHILILTTVLAAWGQFVHANTRISLGPLNWLLAGPRFHRVHHSLAEAHRDKNFASFFPIFDVLFGTAYFPRAGEVTRTGLLDMREPKTIQQYLFNLAPPPRREQEQ